MRRANRALPKPKTGTTQPLVNPGAAQAANAAAAGIKPPPGKGAKQMGIIATTGELNAIKADEARKAGETRGVDVTPFLKPAPQDSVK